MQPGRELDAEIATKVMGWWRGPSGWEWGANEGRCLMAYENWSPSRLVEHAHLVIDRLKKRLGEEFFEFRMQTGGEEWEARVWLSSGGIESERAKTLPHSICLVSLAALRTLEAK